MRARAIPFLSMMAAPGAIVAVLAGCSQIFGIDPPNEVPEPGDATTEGGSGQDATSEAGSGALATQPTSLDFGSVSCGTTAAAQSVKLVNSGQAPLVWSASLGKGSGSPFVVAPLQGTLQGGSSTNVSVTPAAIPATASVAPNGFGDSLSFSATGASATADLKMTARGAIVGVSPTSLHVGAQPYNASSVPQSVTITNSGTATVTVKLASSPPFVASPSSPSVLDAGASVVVAVTFDPQAAGDAGAVLPLTTSLASGDTLCAPAPTGVSIDGTGINGPVELAPGTRHSCTRFSDGSVRCWGSNDVGELGLGTITPDAGPSIAVVSAITGTSQLAAGYRHTCAVAASKTYCWGLNATEQLGNAGPSTGTPTVVAGASIMGALVGEDGTTCAFDLGGSTYCWGDYSGGEFGVDPATLDGGGETQTPTQITVPFIASAISGRGGQTCVLGGGKVACWPFFAADGGITYAPALVPGLTDAVSLAAGNAHACAARLNGAVVCWGSNSNGQLGDGTATDSLVVPVAVPSISDAVAVAVDVLSSCALHRDGTVSCWGGSGQGQLGNGSITDSHVPVPVTGATGVTAIAGGGFHFCMMESGGAVWCWGANYTGQIGDGTKNNALVPVMVQGL